MELKQRQEKGTGPFPSVLLYSFGEGGTCGGSPRGKVAWIPLEKGVMNHDHARRIVQNAVAATRPRWLSYDESWRDIDVIFIKRGYEQQGYTRQGA